MKKLLKKLNDNKEKEGEELKEIFYDNDIKEDLDTKIINSQYYQIESTKKHNELIKRKKSLKKCILIFISIITIIILCSFTFYKYLYKKPVKVEKYNEGKWFIDGKNYFEDLFEKLMEANDTIYISDWWLSPELFLKRPVDVKPYLDMVEKNIIINEQMENMTRLMDVLNYKAKQGVQIYILIYKEFSIALSLNSEYTENIFNKLDKNIKVTRYPSFKDTILWSDHEKLVIIDNIIGYVGGLDLCWGRYDNNKHPIYEAPNSQNIYEFPFIDYANNRINDFSNVEKYYIENVPRAESIRMPWHDVHSRIIGEEVKNISKHFIQRWNFANSVEKQIRFLNLIENDFISKNNKLKPPLKNKEFNMDKKNIDYIDLLSEKKPQLKNLKEIYNFNEIKEDSNIDKNETNKTEIYKKYYFNDDTPPSKVKVLRSVSKWNSGVNRTEHSILNAYYRLIKKAKHYIIIENQFFISKSWNKEERENSKNCISDKVKNKIAYYIRKRIEKAYKKKKNFKVYIFIPLLPAFEGEPQDSDTLKIILKHTYAGICRNYGLSLIEQLEKIMGDEWKNYIGFFSLRNHGLVNNIPKTEIIYIHSKLMIIDDKTVLIGSANINDRSMLGDRDSEFAVIINEKRELESKNGKKFIMDGNSNYNATNFAVELRKALMAEHLGISPSDSILDDPVSNKLYYLFLNRARNNTYIYREIFACYPDDTFINFQTLKDINNNKKLEKAEDLLNKYNKLKRNIVGHIVEFPLLFLKEESLETSWISRENFLPEINFT